MWDEWDILRRRALNGVSRVPGHRGAAMAARAPLPQPKSCTFTTGTVTTKSRVLQQGCRYGAQINKAMQKASHPLTAGVRG